MDERVNSSVCNMKFGPYLVHSGDVWPAGMYTVDMVQGIHLMQSTQYKRDYPRQEDRFEAIFKYPFKKSTYNDVRRRWEMGSPAELQHFINHGHTQ